MFNTELVVLKKVKYQESSLIVHGISPDYGRLDLLIKGALKLGKKAFPAVDLFREIQVEFKESHGSSLHSIYSAELLCAHDAIANYPDNYITANNLGAFLLKNSHPELPCPLTYDAFINALRHLSGETEAVWNASQCVVSVKAVYLQEHGLLPDALNPDPEKNRKQQLFMDAFLDAAINGSPMPECSPGYWGRLEQWINVLCDYHELKK